MSPPPKQIYQLSITQVSGSNIGKMMDKFRPLLTPKVMSGTPIVFAIDFGDSGVWTFDMKDKGNAFLISTC